MTESQAGKAQVRLTKEDHLDQCIRGWQEVAPLWTVRQCEHGRIQRREPGETPMRHRDHRWVDLSRFEHPFLWLRARRALSNPPGVSDE